MAKDKLNNLLGFTEYSELKQFDKSTKHTEIGGDVVNEKKKGCSSCADKAKKGGKKEMPQFILDAIEKKKNRLASEKGGKKSKKFKNIKEFHEYIDDDSNEGLRDWFSNNISEEEALKRIMAHPSKRSMYESLDDNKKKLYLQFVMKNPGVNYVKWDEKAGQFVDSSVYTARTGTGGINFH